eukprot:COSAG01_NODE_2232_length_8117_cov_4.366426_9_plen_63_part_00
MRLPASSLATDRTRGMLTHVGAQRQQPSYELPNTDADADSHADSHAGLNFLGRAFKLLLPNW